MNFLCSIAYLIHAVEADSHNSQVVEFAVTVPTSFYKAFLKMCILKCVICKYHSWIGSFHFEDWAHDQRLMAVFLPWQSFPCEGYKTNFFLLCLVGAATILHQNGKWFTPQDLPGTGVCGDSSGTRVYCIPSPLLQQHCWLVCPAFLSQTEPFRGWWWGVTEEKVLGL